ncbi:class I SAM-dependent methyltransferase [Levilinea saccharolytica]|nr:class I SAM-dependent methyltransferase [Levilinea saccharolytica]GAP18812.1 protein containing methyltransferase domain [Levilinea saccharolytica]
MIELNCRFCGESLQPTSIGRIVNGYELFSCPKCESIGVLSEPTPDQVKKIYDELFSVGGYDQHREEFRLIKQGKVPRSPYRHLLLKFIETRLKGRKMLEIGGGIGSFGVYAESRGWDYTDFDVSEAAVNFAHDLGIKSNCFSSANPPSLPSAEYDLVVMWEVIEHVYDVKGYLDEIYRTLKPGGMYLLSTPNYYRTAYQKSDFGILGSPPVHINFFTKKALESILTESGFEKVNVYKRRLYFPTKLSFRESKTIFQRLLALEESPTLIGIARKPQ